MLALLLPAVKTVSQLACCVERGYISDGSDIHLLCCVSDLGQGAEACLTRQYNNSATNTVSSTSVKLERKLAIYISQLCSMSKCEKKESIEEPEMTFPLNQSIHLSVYFLARSIVCVCASRNSRSRV